MRAGRWNDEPRVRRDLPRGRQAMHASVGLLLVRLLERDVRGHALREDRR